jgi:hypothetical protein
MVRALKYLGPLLVRQGQNYNSKFRERNICYLFYCLFLQVKHEAARELSQPKSTQETSYPHSSRSIYYIHGLLTFSQLTCISCVNSSSNASFAHFRLESLVVILPFLGSGSISRRRSCGRSLISFAALLALTVADEVVTTDIVARDDVFLGRTSLDEEQ